MASVEEPRLRAGRFFPPVSRREGCRRFGCRAGGRERAIRDQDSGSRQISHRGDRQRSWDARGRWAGNVAPRRRDRADRDQPLIARAERCLPRKLNSMFRGDQTWRRYSTARCRAISAGKNDEHEPHPGESDRVTMSQREACVRENFVSRAIMLALALSPALARAQSSVTSVPGGFTFAAAGDLISPKPFDLAINADMARIAELFRHADLGFANQEGAIFDVAEFKGSNAAGERRRNTCVARPGCPQSSIHGDISCLQGQQPRHRFGAARV